MGTLQRDNLTLYRATMHKRQEFRVEDELAVRANRMLIEWAKEHTNTVRWNTQQQVLSEPEQRT